MSYRTIAGLLLVLAADTSDAALIGRAALTPGGTDYQAYYDTVLNITWLADANLAATNSFGVPFIGGIGGGPGNMTWNTAQAWITAMNAANHLGASNWRLPNTTQPDPTCDQQFNPGSGYPLQGHHFYCTGSEMGHLYEVDGITSASPGPFSNVRNYYYWSATEYAPSPTFNAWEYDFYIGRQEAFQKSGKSYAWAVLDGDIAAVPAPAAAWLFGGALAGLGVLRRRQKTA